MTASDHALLKAALHQNLHLFVQQAFPILNPGEVYEPNWHIDAMCLALEKVARGEIRRLIITVPPRHLKSICASVAFPAWYLGRHPDQRILVASYGQELAARHARDCRALLKSRQYREYFPATRLDPHKDTELEQVTTARGGRKGVSLGGAITGFGADILIVDDLLKAADASVPSARQAANDFYENTLFSRLNDKRDGRIIVIQQRLHEDDLPGHLLDKGGFVHLDLPAIAQSDQVIELPYGRRRQRRAGDLLCPQREPQEILDDIKLNIGTMAFDAQYLQDPTPPGGHQVRRSWFPTTDPGLTREKMDYVVQSWDTAIATGPHNDYSVCLTAGVLGLNIHILDVFRARLEYPKLRDAVVNLKRRWRPDTIIVEDSSLGPALVTELRAAHTEIIMRRPRFSKETRLIGQSGRLEQGQVWVPAEAPWLTDFLRELLGFPNARHDDQVDALVQLLEWAKPSRLADCIDRKLHGGRRSGNLRPTGTIFRRRLSLKERLHLQYADRFIPSL